MTSLFIGDIDPKTTKLDIEETLNQHGNFKKLIIKYNKRKSNKMCFFKVYNTGTIKSLIIRPVVINGVEHYCQISQRPQDEGPQDLQEFPFQRRCVFINNIPRNLADRCLMDFFADFGPTESAFSIKKRGRGVGYGFVYFKFEQTANALIKKKKINYKGKFMIAKGYLQKNKPDNQNRYPKRREEEGKFTKKNKNYSTNFEEFKRGDNCPQAAVRSGMDQNLNKVPQSKRGWSGEFTGSNCPERHIRPPPGLPSQRRLNDYGFLPSNRSPDIQRVINPQAGRSETKHRNYQANNPRAVQHYAQSRYRRRNPYHKPYDFELQGPCLSAVSISKMDRIESNHQYGNLRVNRPGEGVYKWF